MNASKKISMAPTSSANTRPLWLDPSTARLWKPLACHYYSSPLARSRNLRSSLLQKCRASSSCRSSRSEAIHTSPRHTVWSRQRAHSSEKCYLLPELSICRWLGGQPESSSSYTHVRLSIHARARTHTHTTSLLSAHLVT